MLLSLMRVGGFLVVPSGLLVVLGRYAVVGCCSVLIWTSWFSVRDGCDDPRLLERC